MTQALIEFLKKFVSFQSISSDPSKKKESLKTAEFLNTELQNLGAETKLVVEMEGKNPVILGRLGMDANKPTLVVYGHYDVQPAQFIDGWTSEPFEQIEKDGYLYGRGTSDDKGPIAITIFAIKELQEEGELPINIRFIYEGEEESGSEGFEEAITANKDFIGNCDGIIIMDTGWFTENNPSMGYGLRGITYMSIEISGPQKDLHSGVGGTIREPMYDLITVMSQLINKDGKAQIEGFYDKVRPVTAEEEALYDDLEFDIENIKKILGVDTVVSNDKKTLLMNTWRYPCISIHGIEGAFSGPGGKTVIPAKVTGKVSMRLVPDQDPDEIAQLFIKHVEKLFSELDSPNKLDLNALNTGAWWYGDFTNYLFKAGAEAISEYWGIKPMYDRIGGSIPIVPFMEKTVNAPAMLLGIGQPSDGAHSQNERIRIKNLVGTKEVIKLLFKKIGDKK